LKVSLGNTTQIATPLRSVKLKPVCPTPVSNCNPKDISKFPGLKGLNIPVGYSPSLWKIDDSNYAGVTDTFLVGVATQASAELGPNLELNDPFYEDFQAYVIPYKEISGNFFGCQINSNGGGGCAHLRRGGDFLPFQTEQSGCFWVEDGKCGVGATFAQNTKLELSLRAPKGIGGWLHGRMSNGNVQILPLDKKLNKLVITGNAIDAQITGTYFHPDEASGWVSQDYESTSLMRQFRWRPDGYRSGVRMLSMFENHLGSKAVGRVSTWNVSQIKYATFSGCDSKTPRLEGLLTTNAMVYNGDLPTYKKGALSYQVGGLHYNHDGSVFKGSYDFIMRSDTARCIYGFTKAPVQVAVTVTDVNGVKSASTSSVSESDGWLRIRARDFTFSTPTITAKITQKLITSVKNDKISQKSLAKIAKVSIGKKDKVTISVSGSNKKFAKVKSGNVSFKKNGTYQVKIKVKHYKGTTETATISVKVK
jgi:hypothetical protein